MKTSARLFVVSVLLFSNVVLAQPAADSIVKQSLPMVAPLSFARLGSEDGLPQTTVRAFVQDAAGFMWFGTQDGLVRYDGNRMQVYRPNPLDTATVSSGYVTALESDPSGKIWVGSAETGVSLYDPTTDKFTRFGSDAAKSGTLSSEGVIDIHRDKKDRIWLAMSGGGLNEYQPSSNSFKLFTTAPLDVSVSAIAEDTEGDLWLGTAAGTVIRFNPNTGETKVFTVDASGVTAIRVDSRGFVWIGTERDGLFVLEPTKGSSVNYRNNLKDVTSLSHDGVYAILEDRLGDLWIGTDNGLNRFDKATRSFTRYLHDPADPLSLSGAWVISLYEDRGGQIWVGLFVGGVSKFDRLRLNLAHHRTDTHAAVSFFEEKVGGPLWVGTYHGGLYRYERNANRVTRYETLAQPDSPVIDLKSGWISAIQRDFNGIVWFALIGQGLIAFNPENQNYQQFANNPDESDSLPSDTVWDIWEDPKGNLWLATWGGGLVKFDPDGKGDRFESHKLEDNKGITSNFLYGLYPDPENINILWLATAKGGLVRYDMASGTAKSFRHDAVDEATLGSDDVLTIHRETDAGGAVWVGTHGGGLNRLDPETGKVERFISSNSGLTNNIVYGILSGNDGKLWLSTNGGGLLRFDPKTKKFDAFRARDGLQSDEFGQGGFLQSMSGELFFGGIGGFNAFMPKDIETDKYVPPVVLTGFKRFNQAMTLPRSILTLPALDLTYSDSFEVSFAALSFAAPKDNRFAYKLDGFDEKWVETDRPYATYTRLDGGSYTLRVRAANRHGVWNEAGIALQISVSRPLWKTWWAYTLYVLALAAGVFGYLQYNRRKLAAIDRERRLESVERDLDLTAAVQRGFLPEKNDLAYERLRVQGFYRAADSCSGDWWWHVQPSPGIHWILVGDVTGHGPGPAMVTAAVGTTVRVLTNQGAPTLDELLHIMNNEVIRVGGGMYQMTMGALMLDANSGRWVLYGAGAPPAFSWTAEDGNLKTHFCVGTPLGSEAFEFGQVEGALVPGMRMMLFTDGMPEIELADGKLLGMRRFARLCEATGSKPLDDAVSTLVTQMDQFRGAQKQDDDWTLVLLEWEHEQVYAAVE
ncbi:MAG: SpoIIE family protein phosphatase [Deltaproteobacteria bacterium]|nr:SpoIIE family protein phosphatase [Deltaproteobacteria bacterium]MDQ3296555.1 SpoIIE family protein phosphatase [Myxococcota bacterium]